MEHEQFILSWKCLQAGSVLFFPEIANIKNLEDPFEPHLQIPLVNLFQELITGNRIKRFLKSAKNLGSVFSQVKFTGHYLLAGCDDEEMMNLNQEGLHSWDTNFFFQSTVTAAFKAMEKKAPEVLSHINLG